MELRGDRLVAGAPREPGAVHVYERTGAVWSATARLSAPDTVDGDQFGATLALDGETIVVGASQDSGAAQHEGSVHVYELVGGEWRRTATLRPSPPVHSHFGHGLALDRGLLVVIAASSPGVTLYEQTAPGTWPPFQELLPERKERVAASGGALFFGGEFGHSDPVDVYEFQQGSWSAFGFGDGSSLGCPCNQESPTSWEAGCRNQCGGGAARLVATGSDSVSADEFRVHAFGLCRQEPALLFSSGAPGAGVKFGSGLLFLAPPFARHGVRIADDLHAATWGPRLAAANGWLPGTSRYFQAWYRDPESFCLSYGQLLRWNLSNAVGVTLAP